MMLFEFPAGNLLTILPSNIILLKPCRLPTIVDDENASANTMYPSQTVH